MIPVCTTLQSGCKTPLGIWKPDPQFTLWRMCLNLNFLYHWRDSRVSSRDNDPAWVIRLLLKKKINPYYLMVGTSLQFHKHSLPK